MLYRPATLTEYEEIAEVHANSWSIFYRNIFSDKFLDNEVIAERKSVWNRRAQEIDKNRFVLIALENQKIAGFSCVYLHHKTGYGALVDNLHVLQEHQGKGVGLTLLQKSFDWIKENAPNEEMFLSVLKDNIKSKEFYYRFGGNFQEAYTENAQDGSLVGVERISWKNRPKFNPK